MNDDDLDYADDDTPPRDGFADGGVGATGNVPVWRLIEMSREDRLLQAELADFEDYDYDDGFGAGCAQLSH